MERPPLETVTETGYALQVLLVSRDEDLVQDLVTQLGADSVVVTDGLEGAERKLGYLDCAVAIFDTEGADAGGANANEKILKINCMAAMGFKGRYCTV